MMKNLFQEGVADELSRRFLSIKEYQKPDWGKMNAGQMICHCSDTLREALGLRPTRSSSNFLTSTFVKWVTFYLISWPKGKLPTSHEYDQQLGGTPSKEFEADRNELLRLLKTMQEQPEWFNFHAHPLFGKLSRKEWGRLTFVHFDHHLRQFGA